MELNYSIKQSKLTTHLSDHHQQTRGRLVEGAAEVEETAAGAVIGAAAPVLRARGSKCMQYMTVTGSPFYLDLYRCFEMSLIHVPFSQFSIQPLAFF
jgi:hypothetical protein